MTLRGWLKRLEQAASKDVVLIAQQDGSVKAFDRMEVLKEMYLLKYDAALGLPSRESKFMTALENATPESRAAVEQMSGGACYEDLEPSDHEPEDLSE